MGIISENPDETNTIKPQPTTLSTKVSFKEYKEKNALELQSDENYSFDGEYKYFLIIKDKVEGNTKTIMIAGQSGTYTLVKIKGDEEIYEGEPFDVVSESGEIKPKGGSWETIFNDAKSWSVNTYFENKDDLLKSIYSDTNNFLIEEQKVLKFETLEPKGWTFTSKGTISDISRFKNISEIKSGSGFILDFNKNGEITFLVRTSTFIRLIPIWDGKQLTFKKSNGSEKNGEIIVTSSSDVAKVEESKFRHKKTLLNEDTKKTGCIKGDCKNGYGTFISSSGSKYVGNFKNGKKNGYGTETYSRGDKYVGNWKNDMYNGYGTFTWSDGRKYVGNWKDSSKNGYGTETYSDGSKYVGNWKYSMYNGYGTYTYSSGNKYVGNFKDNVKNGYGTYTWTDGDKYVGNWKDGYLNGYGTITYSDGNKYVGNWKNDAYNGYGTKTYSDGSKYVGNWKSGKRNGYGTETYSDGTKYVGNWKDNNFNGYGTYTNYDGSKYVGNWKNSVENGYGTYTNPSGCKYSGEWIEGELNGKEKSDYDEITNCTEKPKEKTKEKPKENEVKVDNTIIDEKLNFSTDFDLIADDIYTNLVKGKIPNVSIVSIVEEPTKNSSNKITLVVLKIKIGSTKYRATFNENGLKLQNDSNNNHVKAVWNNRDLTTRPFTAAEKKRIKSDNRLEYDIELLGGDKFIMEETLKRFKQLIK